MDLMLPVMNGLSATEQIMSRCPTPILIVSSSDNRGTLFTTYDALAAGAVDVLEKPSGEDSERGWEERFLATLKLVSRIRVITRHNSRRRTRDLAASAAPAPAAISDAPMRPTRPRPRRLIAIGASTGGPSAVVEVLRAMPVGFPVPILLVLHISRPFGRAFAEWLDGQTELAVGYATDGETLGAARGRVVMAPPDRHLLVRDGRLWLSHDPERYSCRPSVDVLFESVAREMGGAAAACLLTGMGRDGASGLLEVRRAGGLTIAQDQTTSVVYGMPREAVLLGAAQQVLPLDQIGPALARVPFS
jgi:two-component system chemotaxis response regulator CheB